MAPDSFSKVMIFSIKNKDNPDRDIGQYDCRCQKIADKDTQTNTLFCMRNSRAGARCVAFLTHALAWRFLCHACAPARLLRIQNNVLFWVFLSVFDSAQGAQQTQPRVFAAQSGAKTYKRNRLLVFCPNQMTTTIKTHAAGVFGRIGSLI
jgi:hypothetical protein